MKTIYLERHCVYYLELKSIIDMNYKWLTIYYSINYITNNYYSY